MHIVKMKHGVSNEIEIETGTYDETVLFLTEMILKNYNWEVINEENGKRYRIDISLTAIS